MTLTNVHLWVFAIVGLFHTGSIIAQETDEVDINVWDRQYPSVVICLLVRNKFHTLPYFLGYLEELDYPKNRLKLFIRVDHSIDASSETMKTWLKQVSEYYHEINFQEQTEPKVYLDEMGPFDWPDERHSRIIELKEQALEYARQSWADYIFYLDCDVFLTDPHVLKALISSRRVAIAPLLRSTDDDYSTFWTTVDESGEFTVCLCFSTKTFTKKITNKQLNNKLPNNTQKTKQQTSKKQTFGMATNCKIAELH